MNINDLPQNSYTPISPGTSTQGQNTAPMNIRDIPQNSYTVVPQTVPSIPSQIISNLGNTLKQGGQNAVNDIANTGNIAKQAGGSPEAVALAGASTVGHIAGDIAGTAGGILGSFISPFLPQGVKNAVGDVTKFVQDKVNAIPGMTPEIAKGLGDVFNTASLLGGAKAEPVVQGTASDAVDTIKNTAADLTKETPITPEQIQSNLDGVAKDWQNPTTVNEPKYNNARSVLQKDPTVPQTLAQNRINPFENIEDGKYNTEDTAQKLRDDNGTLSKQLLRPSLEIADKSVAPTPIVDFKPSIDDTYGVTADDAETIQNKLASKMAALGRKYPNGMTLTDMLDEKITYDKNGGYKPFKSNADNIDAIANRSIADSIRSTLETKGDTAGVPVKDFNAELAKNYRAADYLDALHGKKAPTSVAQSIARYGAKVVGAKIAGIVGGGDLVSEFVGYHIGGALEKFVENMTNPMRDSFLKNLQVTNPKAFTTMENYLKDNLGK